MKITLLTAGSRGDVQPYVALGAGLSAAGYRVVLATHHGFRNMAESHGLEFAQVSQPTRAVRSSKVWQRWQRSGDNFIHYLTGFYRVSRMASQVIERMLDDFWTASQGADLVISSTSGFGGPHIAAVLNIPHCWALFQPMSRTQSFPFFMTPLGISLSPRLNYTTYRFAEQVYWMLFKPTLNQWRQKTLGLRPLTRPARDTFLGEDPSITLYGFSRFVIPPPPDWGDNIKVCGYWPLETPEDWQPPEALMEFLGQGPPPVYFHLRRMNYDPPAKLVQMVLKALQIVKRRGLFYVDDWNFNGQAKPGSVFQVPAVPHDWLFPRVAAVVHHGGAGTTASALRAGVPSVGIPGFWDQPFWSKRINTLGVGPAPIPPRKLTVPRLVEAIQAMVHNTEIRKRAKRLGTQILNEVGVQRAVEHIKTLLVQPAHERS